MAGRLPLMLPPLGAPPINLTQLVQVPHISPIGGPYFPPVVEEKSPAQIYEVGKVYESKEWILTDTVQVTQDGRILITLDLPHLENVIPGGFDLLYKIFKSSLIYPVLISVFDRESSSYVIWSDVETGKSKVLYLSEDDTETIFISNGLIEYGGEARISVIYEIPSGKRYTIPEEKEEIIVIGSDDHIAMIRTDDEFEFAGGDRLLWGNYDDSIERTGYIKDGHLLWSKDDHDYDFDLTRDRVPVLEQEQPVYTMEQIYIQPQQWIDEILRLNNVVKVSFQIDRLNAIILIHNAGMLTDDDIKYVAHPEFVHYASMTDEQLDEEMVKKKKIYFREIISVLGVPKQPEMNQLYVIRRLLN